MKRGFFSFTNLFDHLQGFFLGFGVLDNNLALAFRIGHQTV